MTTEKMTVHKALCELKTLDSRIQKCMQQNPFVFANKHANSNDRIPCRETMILMHKSRR